MKILIDIGHPAHVHYFKHFIKSMAKNGHTIKIIARNKDVTFHLLNFHHMKFTSRGDGGKSVLKKLLYSFWAEYLILREAIKFRPDLFMSMASFYAAHIAFIMRKPCITFDDTEHNKLNHLLYAPFSSAIITPFTFQKSFGKKQIKVRSLFELGSLSPKRFQPAKTIKADLGLKEDDSYVILRFISWGAIHDKKQTGLSDSVKEKAINELSKYSKVFILSEKNLPPNFQKYRITISPEKMHDVLYHANLFFGESGTMATEAALLGTPSVRVSTLAKFLGNFQILQKAKLLYYYNSPEMGLAKALELIKNPNIKMDMQTNRKIFLNSIIDFTDFVIWFFENYPNSKKLYKQDNLYQNKFTLGDGYE